MKRYLQAVALLFFFAGGIALVNWIRTPKSAPRETVVIKNMVATLDANEARAPYETTQTNENDPPPQLTINAALVKSSIDNRVFYEVNPDQHWPLASLTKLMNGVIALENFPATATRNNLIKRMMVLSDNSAADALADMLGMGSYVALMNGKAQSLNMAQTGFSDASGLSYLNQSTIRDIDKLVTYIMLRHPELLAWSRAKTVRIDGKDYRNINEFASRPDFVGGKTGFTDEANGNLVTVFTTASGPVTVITLGAPTKEDRFIETLLLLSWATRHFKL